VRHGVDFDLVSNPIIGDTELFDLVVVGAGFSGLSAAIVYRDNNPGARVLILDNHDEFGGHARRNTFDVDGTTLIAGGGTYELEAHRWASSQSAAILDRIGLDPDRLAGYWQSDRIEKLGLTAGFFSDETSHGVPSSWARDMYAKPWGEFFAQTNLNPDVAADLAQLCTAREAPTGLRSDDLADRTYRQYIEDDLGLSNDATRFAEIYVKDMLGAGAEALSASAMVDYGPGFDWAGGDWSPDESQRYTYMAASRYPDGMHTLVRGLLAELIPAAFSRTGSLDELFLADVCDEAFELGPVHLRLNSTVVHVEHDGDPDTAERVNVVYVNGDAAHRVHARQFIMAGGGFIARRVLRDMPAENLAAATEAVHCPMVYTNVALRRWTSIAEAGVYWGGFTDWPYQTFMLQHPIYPPGWDAPFDPDEPITVMLTGGAVGQGATALEQAIAGRTALEATSRETHEEGVANLLERMFGATGFQRSDIAAMTINRFGHGYGFFKGPDEDGAHRRARRSWGRISIAHSDSQGEVWAHSAIDAGHRAATERLDHG
ncbi:MAG: NAD(P)-binding protein, partial [Actinomycetia bacterium]|nr:NAD(P)-binding protein [Actinomycetes bacterium]